MFDPPVIDFDPGQDRLDLRRLPILTDADDYEGIHIAVRNLSVDFHKVTGRKADVWTSTADRPLTPGLILIGSLKRCRYLRELAAGGCNFSGICGQWESFEVSLRDRPWSFADRMLVIAGSDKRGAIFGAYTLSEQMGVLPWYWWADVAVKPREHIYALPVTSRHGSPSVQYRDMFINDEVPANFLWPAMWSGYLQLGSSFFADDPLNYELADRFGIVISMSHYEPMQRSTTEWHKTGNGPWNWDQNKAAITDFFSLGTKRSQPFESIITLGMRGEGEGEIDAQDPKATLKDVIETQRKLIQGVYGSQEGVKQVMTLYKEVLGYYEDGLRIPDDVTLMFPDDNYGNIRRLPTVEEQSRQGGVGIYYHLEYVGFPRSYKWMNTTRGKIQQQLRFTYDAGVRKIWVINVGDIKPLELPLTFAMALAWNIDCINPATIPKFFQAYAEREIGSEHAIETSKLLLSHDRLMALRRHEHMEPDTLSLLHYREADIIIERASRIFLDLHTSLARNRMHGQQRRNTTNHLAQRVLKLFDLDWSLAGEYHKSPWCGDKWNHIMKQPHYGFPAYKTYHSPSRDTITGISFMGVAVEGHLGILLGLVNEECCRMQPSPFGRAVGLTLAVMSPYGPSSRYFEIYTQGTRDVNWTVVAAEQWVQFSQTRVARDFDDMVHIDIRSAEGDYEQIHLPIANRRAPEDFCGFVESDGVVSIEVGAVQLTNWQRRSYQSLPYVGRTSSGAVALLDSPTAEVPYLQYELFLFSTPATVSIILYFTMALDTRMKQALCYDIHFDGSAQDDAVQDGVWTRRHSFAVTGPGSHVVAYRPLARGLLLEKLVVDMGGLRDSYLGPPASSHVGQPASQ
ncbi:hypothetical protein BKA61DRAFT_647403 [Leptodontidium sp. MPI-SDFR-AT-0119]|nr:hypothetical protein BKA61DRAFT_647403 [Leptodontidium sp. MPI-SDFR-AT-0119]